MFCPASLFLLFLEVGAEQSGEFGILVSGSRSLDKMSRIPAEGAGTPHCLGPAACGAPGWSFPDSVFTGEGTSQKGVLCEMAGLGCCRLVA